MIRDEAIRNIVIPPHALRVLDALEEAGHEAWCVGGYVRDRLLGRRVDDIATAVDDAATPAGDEDGQTGDTATPAGDIDIASSALWHEAAEVLRACGFFVAETGTKHGTITVVIEGNAVEVTSFRIDGAYQDRRRPESVRFVRSIREDLARRDFSINAIAYHPERGLFDPYGGIRALENRSIEAVGEPERRFSEDALRIVRGLRFSSRLGFSIEKRTFAAMRKCAPLLEEIAVERIFKELEGFLCGAHVHDALMAGIDIVGACIPEALAMKGFEQKSPYHIYDVLEHTAYVLQNTPADRLVRWSAFFHDIGKPAAFFRGADGVGHFYGHAKISVEIARTTMKRLKAPSRLVRQVLTLVEIHDDVIAPTRSSVKRMLRKLDGEVGSSGRKSRSGSGRRSSGRKNRSGGGGCGDGQGGDTGDTDSSRRRSTNAAGELFFALCSLKRGDTLAQAPRCRHRLDDIAQIVEIAGTIIAEQDAFSLKDLAINGNDLLAAGTPPGPAIGRTLNAALEAVIEERVANEHEALLTFVRKNGV